MPDIEASDVQSLELGNLTFKFGHDDHPSGEGYLWHQWSGDEVREFLTTVADIGEAEDRAELGLFTDSEPELKGEFYQVEVKPEGDFEKLVVVWSGEKQQPEGYNPDEPGSSRPVAIRMGYYAAGVSKPEAEEDEGYAASESDDGKKAAGSGWCIQGLAFYAGGGSQGDGDQEQEEDGAYKSKQAVNAVMSQAVLNRQSLSSFGYGITTAEKYIEPIVACSQDGGCHWQHAASKFGSGSILQAEMQKSSERLVYSNEDMQVDVKNVAASGFDKFIESRMKSWKAKGDVEVPKGTLMVFENVVTTARKDRDGDILRTAGAVVDPSMPLLWQHVQVQPIGRMLRVMNHSEKGLVVLSALIDVGSLSQDAAKMVEAGMLRISHGFRPLEFSMLEPEDATEKKPEIETPAPGFDVQKFEVMEESLVSVPANTDAVITMYSRNKFEDPIVKQWAAKMHDSRPKQFQGSGIIGGSDKDASERRPEPFQPDDTGVKEDDCNPEKADGCVCKGAMQEPVKLSGRSLEDITSALCAKLLESDVNDVAILSRTRKIIDASLTDLRKALMEMYR